MSWYLLKSGGDGMEYGFAHKEFLIDTNDDIFTEPTKFGPIAAGSLAHTPGYAMIYEKSGIGEWTAVPYITEPNKDVAT